MAGERHHRPEIQPIAEQRCDVSRPELVEIPSLAFLCVLARTTLFAVQPDVADDSLEGDGDRWPSGIILLPPPTPKMSRVFGFFF